MSRMLTDTATRWRNTKTVSASGSVSSDWNIIGTAGDTPCLVYMATGGKAVSSELETIADTEADKSTHVIRLAFDADVTAGDRLVIGTDTFLVNAIGNSDTNRFLTLAGAVRVRGEGKLSG